MDALFCETHDVNMMFYKHIGPVNQTEFSPCSQNGRVLSHFQFAKRFYVNTVYLEQFHESNIIA